MAVGDIWKKYELLVSVTKQTFMGIDQTDYITKCPLA